MRPDRELQEWAQRGIKALRLEPAHVEPDKPRAGLIVYADGTDWDPGSGAGLYYYNGSAWVLIA
jgi:hypothetical protein